MSSRALKYLGTKNFKALPSTTYHRAPGRFTVGTVVNNTCDKTVNVLMDRWKYIKKYSRFFRMKKKILAHDPLNECSIGDTVLLRDSRPFSKRKRHVVEAIVEKSPEQVALNHEADPVLENLRKRAAAEALAHAKSIESYAHYNVYLAKEKAVSETAEPATKNE